MRTTVFCLAAVLAAAPVPAFAGGTAPEATKAAAGKAEGHPKTAGVDVPSLSVPKLDLGGLGVPKASGLSSDRPAADHPAKGPTKVTFAASDLRLALTFDTTGGGCVTTTGLRGFHLAKLPSTVKAFETCLRLTATAGVVVHLVAHVLDPTGHPVAEAEGDVSFAGAGTTQDFVIAWRGFPVRHPGTYRLEVSLGGRPAGSFPIDVRKSP